MSTTSERLDRLEAENVALKAEVDRLRGQVEPPPPSPPPIIFDGIIGRPLSNQVAMVRTIPDPPPPDLTWENVRELRRIVGKAYPGLISFPDGTPEQEAIARFGNAMRFVGTLVGNYEIDEKHSVEWWIYKSRQYSSPELAAIEFSKNDFIAATLAHGVYYRAWNAESPIEMGLSLFIGHRPRTGEWPLKNRWRHTLKEGQINGPMFGPRSPQDTLYRVKIGPDDPDC